MKKITLMSFILFISIFVVLAFVLPAKDPQVPTTQPAIKKVNTTKNTITTTTTTNNQTSPNLTVVEIAKHNTSSDCYLIVKNKVYSVSSYVSKHPGGRGKIINNCGKEVSGVFASIHSNFAWNLLNDFYIGDLVAN